MCGHKDASILTDKHEMIDRWKQHNDEHVNGTEKEGQDRGTNGFIGIADDGDMPIRYVKLKMPTNSLGTTRQRRMITLERNLSK